MEDKELQEKMLDLLRNHNALMRIGKPSFTERMETNRQTVNEFIKVAQAHYANKADGCVSVEDYQQLLTLAKSLTGLQPWITDKAMKKHFTDAMELIYDLPSPPKTK